MKCWCQNCVWTGSQVDCKPIENLTQRVAVGEPMPAGQCPKCGALCHPLVSNLGEESVVDWKPVVEELLARVRRLEAWFADIDRRVPNP